MKNIFTLLFVFTAYVMLGDGGGDYYERDQSFHVYDYSTGYFITSVTNTVKINSADPKSKSYSIINNIAVYDVLQNTTVHVFDTSFREIIYSVIFEQEFEDSTSSMDIFSSYDYSTFSNSTHYKLMNNFSMTRRAASGNLIIATYSNKTERYTLWLCPKNGKGAKQIFSFDRDNGEGYHLNVKHQKLILISKQNGLLNIQSAAY